MKISFLDLEFMLLHLNLIAFIISIEMEASLLALAKSMYYRTRIVGDRCGRVVKEKTKRTKIPVLGCQCISF